MFQDLPCSTMHSQQKSMLLILAGHTNCLQSYKSSFMPVHTASAPATRRCLHFAGWQLDLNLRLEKLDREATYSQRSAC